MLTACSGKIQLITKPLSILRQLWPGMLIEGDFQSRDGAMFYAASVEVLSFPSKLLLSHFSWYHQLLEVCYYFVPLASPCQEVYISLGVVPLLLDYAQKSNSIDEIKQICMMYILSQIGVHPPCEYNQLMSIIDDIAKSFAENQTTDYAYLGFLLEQELVAIDIKHINNWLYSCLKQHPCFKVFKANMFAFMFCE